MNIYVCIYIRCNYKFTIVFKFKCVKRFCYISALLLLFILYLNISIFLKIYLKTFEVYMYNDVKIFYLFYDYIFSFTTKLLLIIYIHIMLFLLWLVLFIYTCVSFTNQDFIRHTLNVMHFEKNLVLQVMNIILEKVTQCWCEMTWKKWIFGVHCGQFPRRKKGNSNC
jgi:hypothetical protein